MIDYHKEAVRIAGLHCVYRLVEIQAALEKAFKDGTANGLQITVDQSNAFLKEREDE